MDVVEQAFHVFDGLEDELNEGYNNGGGDTPIDIDGQQPLGDISFEDGAQDHNFDLVALEDAMKELYASSKCTKLAIVQSFL